MHKAYIYFLFIFIFISFAAHAQEIDYEDRAATMRSEVWSWDLPVFKNYSVPEEYSGESAVILARHRDISAIRKSNFQDVMKGNRGGRLYYTDIDRRMIKLNDQTAIDRYTEFSFIEEEKQDTYGMYATRFSNSVITVLGVRIIKPNKEIREVDIEASSVSVTEGKEYQESYKKVAIPDLQKGDIIDYFIGYRYEMETIDIPAQYIPFYSSDYPTLNCSARCLFDKKLNIEFRSINGAPSFTREDDEDNAILTVQSDSIIRINYTENIHWTSPVRDFPMIRFIIRRKKPATYYQSANARPAGIYENVPYTDILKDAKSFFAYHHGTTNAISYISKKVSEIIKSYKLRYPEATDNELANVIYSALNFKWPEEESPFYSAGAFMMMLNNLLKDNSIECKLGFATNRFDARREEILDSDDLYYIVTANNDSLYFFPPYRYRVPGEVPYTLQGEPATMIRIDNVIQRLNKSTLQGIESEMILPVSEAQENTYKSVLEVSFLPEDSLKVKIKRHTLCKGALKGDMQPQLLLYEDWDIAMRKYLHIEKTFIEELDEKRATRKYIDKISSNFKRQREEQQESIKKEIFSYHGAEPEKVLKDSIVCLGVTVTEPDLVYELAYTMEGFVKKAGNNLILDVGKLIGTQWVPSDNERKRNADTYLPTRSISERDIHINIPEDYEVEGIEALNMDYANDCASFKSKCSMEGNILTIQTEKNYLKPFITKDEWDKLLEIADKATNFYSTSIILRKR